MCSEKWVCKINKNKNKKSYTKIEMNFWTIWCECLTKTCMVISVVLLGSMSLELVTKSYIDQVGHGPS